MRINGSLKCRCPGDLLAAADTATADTYQKLWSHAIVRSWNPRQGQGPPCGSPGCKVLETFEKFEEQEGLNV